MTGTSHFSELQEPPFTGAPILVVGSRGMLARDLLDPLKKMGLPVLGLDLPQIDITKRGELFGIIKTFSPALLINCSGYTAVDQAESEPDLAFAVNRDGPANLAAVCQDLKIPLIHISTDYVFDGQATIPYCETDSPNPLGVYGQSKWQGELAIRAGLHDHLIVRTSWMFGVPGTNFVKTIIRLAREREELRIVGDQYGSPTWTRDLAEALIRMAFQVLRKQDPIEWGTYHFCGGGYTTWHAFAEVIVNEVRPKEPLKVTNVIPIPTSEYLSLAKRPAWSVLDCSKIGKVFNIVPRPWATALSEMISEYLTA